MTKSGQIGANFCFCSGVSVFHLVDFIQETSGDRSAPVDSLNPVLESKQMPVLSFSAQTPSCPAILKLRFPVSESVGGIIEIYPHLFLSMRKSRFS